jgi:hypothetical protein
MKLDASSKSANSLEKKSLSSFKFAWKRAQCKKPRNIGEELVKPAAIAMATTVCGEETAENGYDIAIK